jgi:polysaccharide pyruvyl transferase WcaK-like protein
MKRPTPDQLRLAADWCEGNDGDEASDLKAVADWLNRHADDADIRALCHSKGVSVGALRAAIARRKGMADS